MAESLEKDPLCPRCALTKPTEVLLFSFMARLWVDFENWVRRTPRAAKDRLSTAASERLNAAL